MRKWLGRLLLALLFSLLVGLAIGTWLRLRLERPVYYIGAASTSALAVAPLDLADAGAAVLDAGHHEEQVG
jgi:hypothetical protein